MVDILTAVLTDGLPSVEAATKKEIGTIRRTPFSK
jgi:hypothetical protein